MLLIALGLILLLVEALTPGFGLFGISGIISMALGALLVITVEPTRWVVSSEWMGTFVWMIVAITAPIAAFAAFTAYKVIEVRRRKPVLGAVVDEIAEAVDDIDEGGEGFVIFRGELWMARALRKVAKGSKVRIVAKDGPRLVVEPLERKSQQ